MGTSERDTELLQRATIAAEAAARSVVLEGTDRRSDTDRQQISEAARRRWIEEERVKHQEEALARELLKQLAAPVQRKAVAELLAFDPNKDKMSRDNLLHEIVGEDLLAASNRIKDEGVKPMMKVNATVESTPSAETLAFVRGKAVAEALISALARKGESIPLAPSTLRHTPGAERELFPTRIRRVYIIKTTGLPNGWADSAELVAATPGYVKTQMPKPSQPSRG